MKKKSPRGIPDFSRKPSGFKPSSLPDVTKAPKVAPPPPPKMKPQQTASKSGNRGK